MSPSGKLTYPKRYENFFYTLHVLVFLLTATSLYQLKVASLFISVIYGFCAILLADCVIFGISYFKEKKAEKQAATEELLEAIDVWAEETASDDGKENESQ